MTHIESESNVDLIVVGEAETIYKSIILENYWHHKSGNEIIEYFFYFDLLGIRPVTNREYLIECNKLKTVEGKLWLLMGWRNKFHNSWEFMGRLLDGLEPRAFLHGDGGSNNKISCSFSLIWLLNDFYWMFLMNFSLHSSASTKWKIIRNR